MYYLFYISFRIYYKKKKKDRVFLWIFLLALEKRNWGARWKMNKKDISHHSHSFGRKSLWEKDNLIISTMAMAILMDQNYWHVRKENKR